MAVVPPPTSLEDYKYVPEGYYDSSLGTSSSEAMARDMTMWMYVQPMEEEHRKQAKRSGKRGKARSPTAAQPSWRPHSEGSVDGDAPPSASSSTCTWTKLRVNLMVPCAATRPLSRELRAGLQLRLVDSQAMTYTSHGASRAGSLSATPMTRSIGHAESQPLLQTCSRPDSESYFKEGSYGSRLHGHSMSDPRGQLSGDAWPYRSRDPSEGCDNACEGSQNSHQGAGSLCARQQTEAYSPALAKPGRLLHRLREDPLLSRVGTPGGSGRSSGVIDSLAALYQVEVRGTAVASAEGIPLAERKRLSRPHLCPWGKGGKAQPEPVKAKHHESDKVTKKLLSWLSLRRGKKTSLKYKSPERNPSPTSPAQPQEPLFPENVKASLFLRFFSEGAYLWLLRWYVWMRHTRHERQQRTRRGKGRREDRSHDFYNPCNMHHHDAVSDPSSDDDDDGGGGAEGSCKVWSHKPLCSHSNSGSALSLSDSLQLVGGGRGSSSAEHDGSLPEERRWEGYVRRARDPRNDLTFATVPIFLWHSFLPLAGMACYRFDRGFLAVESSHGSDSEEVLSPLRTAQHPGKGSSVLGNGAPTGGKPPKYKQQHNDWNTVSLIISSPPLVSPAVAARSASSSAGNDPQQPSPEPHRHRHCAKPLRSPRSHGPLHPSAKAEHLCLPHRSVGAEFKDCFMCLTESHLLFYNSFGELKVHFSLNHIVAVVFSAATRGGHGHGSGAAAAAVEEGAAAAAGDEAGAHLPPSYPFVCFKIQPGKREMKEPCVFATFTFLPLLPHFTPEDLAKDCVDTPQTAGVSRMPVFPADGSDANSAEDEDEDEEDGDGREEGLGAYQAYIRAQSKQLVEQQGDFLTVLKEVMPNTLSDPISFGAYVSAVRQHAALPVSFAEGRPREAEGPFGGKVPYVEIFPEDVTAHPDQSSGFSCGSLSTRSSKGQGEGKPQAGQASTPHAGPRRHSPSSDHRKSIAPYVGSEEHRRLQSFYANSSFLSCSLSAMAPNPTAASSVGMEKVSDFDLTVLLASHPMPLVLEKEDLFLPPLGYYSSGGPASSASERSFGETQDPFSGLAPGDAGAAATTTREKKKRTCTTRGADRPILHVVEPDRQPNPRPAKAAVGSSPSAAGAHGGDATALPRSQSPTDGLFAAFRPRKRMSYLYRTKKAPH